MKIDLLQIKSPFKNLNDVKINFDEESLMTVVIGWNGAGKSNVIEALVSIFRNLDLGESPDFAYEIVYILGALLSKLSEGRADAICSWFYNTGTVTGLPSRVKRFSTAARTCSSAT